MSQRLGGSDNCPICRRNFENCEQLDGGDAYRVVCKACGQFDISATMLGSLSSEHVELLPYLSAHTRQKWEFEGRRVRLGPHWHEYAETHRHTSVHQRFQKLLRTIERRTRQLGEPANVDSSDYPLVDVLDQQALHYFIKYGTDEGYLSGLPPKLCLTFKGWDYLDPGSSGAGIPGRVFVAMRFTAALDDAYEKGIKKAIEQDCGMSAIRIDRVPHGEKICDKILAEIRRCQFVVADVTDQRQNVYFEAGFAMGIGRQVIWTCREDEVSKLQFDTRQYPHILWDTPEKLREGLSEMIHARFPAAAAS
jgi:hypothetical protein